MSHIVLLGDSIFDNKAYVYGVDVIKQLQTILPKGWNATLRAKDGSLIHNIKSQLENLPTDASHLVISIGGNNILSCLNLFGQPIKTCSEALLLFYYELKVFEKEYLEMLVNILTYKLPIVICTIYNPNFPNSDIQYSAVTALTIFNDCIIRLAFEFGIPLIDLRLVCNSPDDYANSIEPSSCGGEKISVAILKSILEHNFETKRTSVFIN